MSWKDSTISSVRVRERKRERERERERERARFPIHASKSPVHAPGVKRVQRDGSSTRITDFFPRHNVTKETVTSSTSSNKKGRRFMLKDEASLFFFPKPSVACSDDRHPKRGRRTTSVKRL